MASNDNLREAAHANLHAATSALNEGRMSVALRETLDAANCIFALFKHEVGCPSDEYTAGWVEFARRLSRLPPSVVREAVRIIDEDG